MEKVLTNGGHGSIESRNDEEISKLCMLEILEYCHLNFHFENYHFKYLSSLSEKYVYEHNGFICENINNHKIVPDGGIILLVNNDDEKKWFLVATVEDKKQDSTNGNAIERYTKNFNFFFNDVSLNNQIAPYILFCKGSFVNDDGTINDFLHSKLRISIPKIPPTLWDVRNPNTSFKNCWNRVYMKKDSFTKEEKYSILLETVIESINYYKIFLK
jgi:hypothetical protein